MGGVDIPNPYFRTFSKLNKKYIGLIGNEFLERFSCDIDLKNMKLYIKPNENLETESFKNTTGFTIKVNNDKAKYIYSVSAVFVGSNADKIGILPDDIIMEINGILTENIGINSMLESMHLLPDSKIKLKIKRNNQIMEKEYLSEKILTY